MKFWKPLPSGVIAMMLCLSAFTFSTSGSVAHAQNRTLPDFTDLVEQVGPSVVNIRTMERPSTRGGPEVPPGMEEFFRRFGIDEKQLGLLFFAVHLLNAASHLGAAWLASRIGLVNTMVFTHTPSSILTFTIPFTGSFELAALPVAFSAAQVGQHRIGMQGDSAAEGLDGAERVAVPEGGVTASEQRPVRTLPSGGLHGDRPANRHQAQQRDGKQPGLHGRILTTLHCPRLDCPCVDGHPRPDGSGPAESAPRETSNPAGNRPEPGRSPAFRPCRFSGGTFPEGRGLNPV